MRILIMQFYIEIFQLQKITYIVVTDHATVILILKQNTI
jgi:hypothetical protein